MAHKHIEDNCEVNVAVDDDGRVVYVCTCCKKIWIGSIARPAEADSANKQSLLQVIQDHPRALAELEVDEGYLINSLED